MTTPHPLHVQNKGSTSDPLLVTSSFLFLAAMASNLRAMASTEHSVLVTSSFLFLQRLPQAVHVRLSDLVISNRPVLPADASRPSSSPLAVGPRVVSRCSRQETDWKRSLTPGQPARRSPGLGLAKVRPEILRCGRTTSGSVCKER